MTRSERPGLGMEGVVLHRPPTFVDERGMVMRMVRVTDPHFAGFGEIYFSMVLPGVVKAWKKHSTLTASYACVAGRVRMVLFDDRPGSSTAGAVRAVDMSPADYSLLIVPPGVWNGFVGLDDGPSVVVNCASEVYDAGEFQRLEPNDESIPYDWGAVAGETGGIGT